jgi:alcohol dehydrogenase (cytochrome c)
MGKFEVSRRKFIAASAAGAVVMGSKAFAQEATPEVQQGEAGNTTLSVSQVGPVAESLGPAIPEELTVETNWAVEGYDLQATRNVLGSGIDSGSIGELGTAWNVPVEIPGSYGPLTSQPIIVNGVLYVQDAKSNVRAIDIETGEIVWYNEYNLDVPSGGPNGVAVGYGMIVYPLGNSDVVAAKVDTGEEIWRTNIGGWRGEGITMPPAIYDSTVYISNIPGSLSEFYNGGQRGFIFALELASGRVLWYFDTTTDNLWGNARGNSGGGLWHVPSFDEEGNIYVGTGNPGPFPGNEQYPAGSSRPGDNNYTDSVIRINPETAGIDWFINVRPGDLFDLDQQLTPIVADVDGVPMVFASGKHGYVLGINRETGEELWRTAVGVHQNDDVTDLPTEGDPLEVYPGSLGGVETPIAYSNGIVFAPLLNNPTYYTATGFGEGPNTLANANGQLVAVDAATGEILWDVTLPSPQLAGATVINDLVFTGGLDGVVRALSVEDGTQVWSWQAAAGINAPLAASGDYLFVAAGGPLIASTDTLDPNPNPNTGAAVTALKIGGEIQQAGTPATGSEESATPAEEGAATGGDGTSTSVTAIDIAFEQKELSIAADTDVTVTVTNNGFLQHDWVVEDTDFASPMLNGGDSAEVIVNLPAGTYTYYCSVAGHREAGMQGTLTVG